MDTNPAASPADDRPRIDATTAGADRSAPAKPDASGSLATPARSPRLSTAWWGLLIRAIVAFLMLLSANLVAAVAVEPLAELAPDDPIAQGFIIVAACAMVLAIVVLLVWAWMRLVERRPFAATGWSFSWRGLWMLLAGTVASVVVMGVVVALGVLLPLPVGAPIEVVDEAVPVWLVVVAVLARAYLLQGIPEELLYRGWLFSVTRERPILTLVWTSLAFMIIHLISSGGQQTWVDHLVYLGPAGAFGAFAGALVLLTGSMWVAAGVHGGFHVASAIIMSLYPAQPTNAEWLLITAVYFAATAVAVWVWARRRARVA